MQLTKILYNFKKIVVDVAESALDTSELHLWYLIDKVIFLAFFDIDVLPELHRQCGSNVLMPHSSSTDFSQKEMVNQLLLYSQA